jgi:hypothetical protein
MFVYVLYPRITRIYTKEPWVETRGYCRETPTELPRSPVAEWSPVAAPIESGEPKPRSAYFFLLPLQIMPIHQP